MKIELKNLTLNYIKEGNGKTLILLHGNGENCHIFDNLIAYYKNSFLIYAIDSRGHGKSKIDVNEFHYQDMANDLDEFITKLNIKNPIIFGFSDGAIIALLFKLKHLDYDCKLILAGLNVTPDGVDNKYINETIKESLKSQNKKEKLLASLMLKEPNITAKELNTINCSVALIYGENDMILKDHQIFIYQNIKNSTLEIISKEDHGSYVYDNNKLKDVLKKYLF